MRDAAARADEIRTVAVSDPPGAADTADNDRLMESRGVPDGGFSGAGDLVGGAGGVAVGVSVGGVCVGVAVGVGSVVGDSEGVGVVLGPGSGTGSSTPAAETNVAS
ncbi:hypothetical protein [Actinomadura miaoliensis]|uniref:hypothetical protein n=1 Tax=Actinomadura miaoliensis TaxID=430685 RepID=UPI0031EEA0A3